MPSSLPPHLQTLVDAICEQGCEQVKHTIARLQQGKRVSQVESLSMAEQQRVLRELESIMAVYLRQP